MNGKYHEGRVDGLIRLCICHCYSIMIKYRLEVVFVLLFNYCSRSFLTVWILHLSATLSILNENSNVNLILIGSAQRELSYSLYGESFLRLKGVPLVTTDDIKDIKKNFKQMAKCRRHHQCIHHHSQLKSIALVS